MEGAAIVVLDGLSYASTLFVMAAGLTLVFGVTRIVNFAHGSFFMLGALFSAHWLVNWFPAWADSAALYALALLAGAVCAALLGALTEWLLLRRLYGAPELYQLVATFGLALFLHDAMRAVFGVQEVFAPRFPGLKGSFAVGEAYFPQYQLLMIALGPCVWGALHWLLNHSWWGKRLRAATQDRDMLSALGIAPQKLMLLAVVLGCALAGLGGALQVPREPAHLQMDMNSVVETFVVVVTGGLGSIGGAWGAAVLIGLVHSVGTAWMPQATQVLVFATMGLVLVLRPQGLLGKPQAPPAPERAQRFVAWPASTGAFCLTCGLVAGALLLAAAQGEYGQTLVRDLLVLLIVGVSLQVMMALGALVSFGHAAFFGLGAYAAAWVNLNLHWGLLPALFAGATASLALALVLGGLLVRSSGVYLAMLSLALAQMLWAAASQWVSISGGDNGLTGVQLVQPGERPAFTLLLVGVGLVAVAGLRIFSASGMGAALQAVRDAPERALASGLPVWRLRYLVLLQSATLAGLAGALLAAHKGSVFPSTLSVATSVDMLLVVLLGGLQQLWGTLVGAAVLVLAGSELARNFEYWRGALGLLVMAIMVWAPMGILGVRGGRRTGGRHA